MTIGIYKLQINKNFYVGQSVNIEHRFKRHFYLLKRQKHKNSHLQCAYNKYNEFSYEILIICAPEHLDLYEQRCLDVWYGTENCMNLSREVESIMRGRKHTDNTRVKIGVSRKGKSLSEETKEKMSRSRKGKPKSEKTKAKMSAVAKGKPKSEKHKARLRGPKSEKTRAKMSAARIGKPSWNKGKHLGEETRAKIGTASKCRAITMKRNKETGRYEPSK